MSDDQASVEKPGAGSPGAGSTGVRAARGSQRKKNKKTLYIVLGVVLALAVAGAAWAVLGGGDGKIASEDVSTSTADATGSAGVAGSGDETMTAGETTPTVASEPEGGDADPVAYDPDTYPPVIEQQTGVIAGVTSSGGSYVLSIDFVQFLTGEEAAAAAEAHGDEVPENDFYVVNDNPKVREYPIQAGLAVRVTTNLDGTVDPMGRAVPVADWAAIINGANGAAYKGGTYIVTVTNGVVTSLEQLYLP
jgi:hypothetical protein